MWPVRFCLLMAVAIHPIHFGYTPLVDAQTTAPTKLGGVSILDFAFDPTTSNLLYAATGDGVFTISNRIMEKGLRFPLRGSNLLTT